MNFVRRYFSYLLIVPVAIGLPMALLFLSQVEQLSLPRWAALLLIMAGLYAVGSFLFVTRLLPRVREVDDALVRGSGNASEALSRCLRRTVTYSNWLWIFCGLAFSLLAASFVGHDFSSIRHFLVASALAAGPACAWSYGAAKHLLTRSAAGARHVRYIGRHRLTVTRKIAILFV